MNAPINSLLRTIGWLIADRWDGQPAATTLIVSVSGLAPGQTATISQGQENIMITLRTDYILKLQVSGKDAKGFPAPLENVTYTSSAPEIAAVDAAGLVTPVGVGLAQINVTADARIGPEEKVLTGLVEITVVAGEAVTLDVGGAPTPA